MEHALLGLNMLFFATSEPSDAYIHSMYYHLLFNDAVGFDTIWDTV